MIIIERDIRKEVTPLTVITELNLAGGIHCYLCVNNNEQLFSYVVGSSTDVEPSDQEGRYRYGVLSTDVEISNMIKHFKKLSISELNQLSTSFISKLLTNYGS